MISAPQHQITDRWREAVVVCSCGWRGAERTMNAALTAWRTHKSEHKRMASEPARTLRVFQEGTTAEQDAARQEIEARAWRAGCGNPNCPDNQRPLFPSGHESRLR